MTALEVATALSVLGARVLRARRRDQHDPGEHAEDNTYGLPDGQPIADELRDWLRKQKQAVLDAIPDETIPDRFPDLTDDQWTDPMAKRMTPLLGAYWDESGKEVFSRLGLDPNEWRVVNPHLRDQIYKQSFAFCQSTNESTSLKLATALARLKDHFAAGLATEGETVRELTKRVEMIFDGLSHSHAAMIAATEASRAVHAAELTADVESEVVAGLELLLSSDACPLCRKIATECKRVRLGDSFATIGDNPHYKDVRHPPLHPHCQCTIIEVLKPEYGGPVAPDWGQTLNQPQKGLGGEYKPPHGKTEPKPEPDRPKPVPTKPPPKAKTIEDRLREYTEGDRKLAAIRAIGDEVSQFSTDVVMAREAYKHAEKAITSEPDWLDSTPEAKARRNSLRPFAVAVEEAEKRFKEAQRTAGARVVKILEVPEADRAKWSGINDETLSSKVRPTAKEVLKTLSGIVKSPGQEISVAWKNFKPGEKRAYQVGLTTGDDKRYSRVVIGGSTDRKTIAHELGHAIEWQTPGVHQRVKEWLAYRCGDEQPQPMKKLFPSAKYKPDEVGRKDQFDRYFDLNSAYYTGKVYPASMEASEVVSMGIQALFESPHKFVTKDPDFAKFILGILDGSIR